MEAVVRRVEGRPCIGEQLDETLVDGLGIGLVEVAASDARLVADENESEPGGVKRSERFSGAGQQPYLLGSRRVADVLDQRAIAIEKDRRTS